jgi:putative transposase
MEKKKSRKKKKYVDTEKILLTTLINTYSQELWKPENIQTVKVDSHSWFNINSGKNNVLSNDTKYKYNTTKLEPVTFKSSKRILLLNDYQKKVMLSWMDSYIDMYNATLKFMNTKLFSTKDERKRSNKFFQILKEINTLEYNNQIGKIKFDKLLMNGKSLETKLKLPKKKMMYKKSKIPVNFQYIRPLMTEKKCEIINNSGLTENKTNTRINVHTLDNAIHDVCTAFTSAFTNLRRGNIKNFRIRYIKKTKPQKFIKLEQSSFCKNKNTFCEKALGKVIKTSDEHDFSDVYSGGTILYDKNNDRFTLVIPEKLDQKKIKEEIKNQPQKKESIGIDPGIKEFLVGYSNGHILEIEPHLRDKIVKYLKEMDTINKIKLRGNEDENYNKYKEIKSDETLTEHQKKISKKNTTKTLTKQQKVELIEKIKQKLKNMIDDLHWKTAKYLTDNYKVILIGNLSTKSIIKKKSVNEIDKMTKRVAQVMRLYVFRERLKNRCYLKGCEYKLVNERHTSQMCTYCGNIKKDLGNAKTYNCENCKKTIGRDINGARNIFMKGIQWE